MLSLKELSTSTLAYLHFHMPDRLSDMLVAFSGCEMIAVQYTNRYADPRTGTLKTPVTTPVEYALSRYVLMDMNESTVSSYVLSKRQQEEAKAAIEWAFACHAAQASLTGKAMALPPVWALIVESIPDPNTEPTILQPEPAKKQRKSKGAATLAKIIEQHIESPVIGTEEESNA